MTVREIVEKVICDLGDINVPVSMLDSVGMPIAHAIQGLQLCVDAWGREDEEARQEDDGVKVEIVPAEEVPEEIREELDRQQDGAEG